MKHGQHWFRLRSFCSDLKLPVVLNINTLRLRQNGRHFADDIFKCIFLNENIHILIKISLKFVHKGPINNIPALVQIMAWCRPGDKPLPEPMLVDIPTHICIIRPSELTHWGRDKMAAIFQTTFSDAFSRTKMYIIWLRFPWSLFPRVQLTIFYHWFRQWLGLTSQCLYQCWYVLLTHICVTWPQWVNSLSDGYKVTHCFSLSFFFLLPMLSKYFLIWLDY